MSLIRRCRRLLPCLAATAVLAACEREAAITEALTGTAAVEEPATAAEATATDTAVPFDGPPSNLSGSYTNLTITTNAVLDGNLHVANDLKILAGGSLTVRGFTVTAGNSIVLDGGGKLVMRSTISNVATRTLSMNVTPNHTDSTLLSAGTLRIVGGVVPLASGTHTVVVDNTQGGCCGGLVDLGRIQNLSVTDTSAWSTYFRTIQLIRGNLTVHRGTFGFDHARVLGTVRSYPGTTIQGMLHASGPLKLEGILSGGLRLVHGTPVVIPNGPGFNYVSIIVDSGTVASVNGTLNVGSNFTVWKSTLDVANDSNIIGGILQIINGTLKMQHASGFLQAQGMDTPQQSDSTLLSAGRIRLTGNAVSSNHGNFKTSGTHTLEIAGSMSTYIPSVQNLEITNGAVVTSQGGVTSVVKGRLWVKSGTLQGAEITTKGIARVDAGATFKGAIRVEGSLAVAGTFSPSTVTFAQGGSFAIPYASRYTYNNVTVTNNTAARLIGPIAAAGQFQIVSGSSLDIGSYSLDVASQMIALGTLRMQNSLGVLETGSIQIGAPNMNDSTLFSAGTLRLVGAGNPGNTYRAAGTFKIVMAGSAPQQLSIYSVPFLEITNPTTTTVYSVHIKNKLTLSAGTMNANNGMIVLGTLETAAGTTVNGPEIKLQGALNAAGTFTPNLTYFRQGGIFVLPVGANYQYKNIQVENGTELRLGGNVNVNGNITLAASGNMLNIRGYKATLTGGVVGTMSALKMQYGGGILDASFVSLNVNAPNDLDPSLLSAGTIYLRAGNGQNYITRASGTHRIIVTGTAAQSLGGKSLQDVWFVNPTTVSGAGIQEIKGLASVRSGTWNSPAIPVGTLQLLSAGTLNSTGAVTYCTLDNRGGTITGVAPVQRTC